MANPVLGFQIKTEDVRVINRTGSDTAVGDLVQFDIDQGSTEVTNALFGDDLSAYCNVIQPEASGEHGAFYGVCLDVIADDNYGRVRIRGKVRARCGHTTAAGTALAATAGADTLGNIGQASVSKGKTLAFAEGAKNTAGLAPVIFDGIYGFGSQNV